MQTVLLDSVASQANRIEEALLEGWRRGNLQFPVIAIDFSHHSDLADLEQITSLQAPHRVAERCCETVLMKRASPFARLRSAMPAPMRVLTTPPCHSVLT